MINYIRVSRPKVHRKFHCDVGNGWQPVCQEEAINLIRSRENVNEVQARRLLDKLEPTVPPSHLTTDQHREVASLLVPALKNLDSICHIYPRAEKAYQALRSLKCELERQYCRDREFDEWEPLYD